MWWLLLMFLGLSCWRRHWCFFSSLFATWPAISQTLTHVVYLLTKNLSDFLDVLCNWKLLVCVVVLSFLWLNDCWRLLLLVLTRRYFILFINSTQSFIWYRMKLALWYMWTSHLSLIWYGWWICFHKIDFTSTCKITMLTSPHIIDDLLRFWRLWSFH